jgi:hypothetical protein
MPRYVFRPEPPSPKHDKLVKKLVQEFTASGKSLRPLILERHLPMTKSRHVHVVWDAWSDVPDEERAAIITDAYTEAEGAEAAADVTIALGVTPREALALGLLPYKVEAMRKRDGPIPVDGYKAAFEEEGRNTLLGARAREPRYARIEDAEAVKERLEQALPGSSWAVVQEVAVGS